MSGEVAWTRQDAEQKDTEKVRLWLNNKTDQCSSRSSKVSEAESCFGNSSSSSSSSVPTVKIETEEASPSWLVKEEESGEDDDDGFLFIGEPPPSDEDIELPPGFADLVKRYPDSSMLRRRTNIPPQPPPRSDGDSSEVNRYRPFRRFARSPTPQKSTAWSAQYVLVRQF